MEKTYRILLVDDEETTLDLLKVLMKVVHVPTQTHAVTNGEVALKELHSGTYDLMVLDLMLPGMPGQDILRSLNDDPKFKGFPVLIHSTVGDLSFIENEIKVFQNLKLDVTGQTASAADIPRKVETLLPIKNEPYRYKVLVVDDDSAVRAMYVPFFKSKNYDVLSASNGKDALALLSKERIDLIILDLTMPVMSGDDVLKAMSANPEWRKIPVIIDTALASDDQRLKAIKAEFNDKLRLGFFERPTSLDQLNAAIGRILAI